MITVNTLICVHVNKTNAQIKTHMHRESFTASLFLLILKSP